ncbi:hypothetical protein FB451DRAFT_1288998 [Mycena latifolia]|nr:hypothetical protein FB451DRAFT_1288998 [Mycena latifolia]
MRVELDKPALRVSSRLPPVQLHICAPPCACTTPRDTAYTRAVPGAHLQARSLSPLAPPHARCSGTSARGSTARCARTPRSASCACSARTNSHPPQPRRQRGRIHRTMRRTTGALVCVSRSSGASLTYARTPARTLAPGSSHCLTRYSSVRRRRRRKHKAGRAWRSSSNDTTTTSTRTWGVLHCKAEVVPCALLGGRASWRVRLAPVRGCARTCGRRMGRRGRTKMRREGERGDGAGTCAVHAAAPRRRAGTDEALAHPPYTSVALQCNSTSTTTGIGGGGGGGNPPRIRTNTSHPYAPTASLERTRGAFPMRLALLALFAFISGQRAAITTGRVELRVLSRKRAGSSSQLRLG